MNVQDSLTEDLSPLENARREISEEYFADHNAPWIIGFSGGKDSTLVAHLIFEYLLELPRSDRKRQVHLVSNDTLVESPLVSAHLINMLKQIGDAAVAFELPLKVALTSPSPEQTFWVNLIGRGYPPPTRGFRWCTDRMKIQPTSQYIKDCVDDAGMVVLILGVRRSESAARAATVSRYDNGERLNKHNDLANCWVFRPIVDFSTDDVWEFLGSNNPPWGGSHRQLIQLYRDAGGGECPVVTSREDSPSCGTSSSRFGCWTCTVVEQDRSLSGFVEAGFEQFSPLLDFRDWLIAIRNDPERRLARRRGGRISFTSTGAQIPGPFTLQTRFEMLDRLLELQRLTDLTLISASEISKIRALWTDDAIANVNRVAQENELIAEEK